ncbi:unnamed protein product [Timema podura]|uniref:ETS domain-containing protein n=1 Tax=Timema podura TaxID=61482 RepID=A0ABN7PKB8_TIMPD|nr:unnamed protein product [Timema podura]
MPTCPLALIHAIAWWLCTRLLRINQLYYWYSLFTTNFSEHVSSSVSHDIDDSYTIQGLRQRGEVKQGETTRLYQLNYFFTKYCLVAQCVILKREEGSRHVRYHHNSAPPRDLAQEDHQEGVVKENQKRNVAAYGSLSATCYSTGNTALASFAGKITSRDMFRFVHSEGVAKLWGTIKENPRMNYEKLSRAMRYYYKSKVLQPVLGRRLVYKFGPTAKGWRTPNPNFKNPE